MAHFAGTGAIIGLPHQQQGRSTDDGKTRGGGSADHGRDRSLRTKMPSACPAPVSDRRYGRRRCKLPGERPALLSGGKSSLVRSEERRVGKECVRTCRCWWTRYHKK